MEKVPTAEEVMNRYLQLPLPKMILQNKEIRSKNKNYLGGH